MRSRCIAPTILSKLRPFRRAHCRCQYANRYESDLDIIEFQRTLKSASAPIAAERIPYMCSTLRAARLYAFRTRPIGASALRSSRDYIAFFSKKGGNLNNVCTVRPDGTELGRFRGLWDGLDSKAALLTFQSRT
jgi:hypothetical protein